MNRREELHKEYLKEFEFVQKYDDYFIRIKSWSVGLAAAVAAFKITDNLRYSLAVVILISFIFWCIELYYFRIQCAHILVLQDMEKSLRHDGEDVSNVNTLSSFLTYSVVRKKFTWYIKRMFRAHIMLPYSVIIFIALITMLCNK